MRKWKKKVFHLEYKYLRAHTVSKESVSRPKFEKIDLTESGTSVLIDDRMENCRSETKLNYAIWQHPWNVETLRQFRTVSRLSHLAQ